MAYELSKDPFDTVKGILYRYINNIAVLKCDIHCKRGRFLKGSIVYIKSDDIICNKIILSDNTIKIRVRIFDCSERNGLDNYDPYKEHDVFTINAENSEKLIAILDNLFLIDDNRTQYHEEYVSLRRKVREYNVNEFCVCRLTKTCFYSSGIIVMLLLISDKILKYNLRYTKYEIIILAVMMILCWCIKIFTSSEIMHKIENLEKISDNLHTKILTP